LTCNCKTELFTDLKELTRTTATLTQSRAGGKNQQYFIKPPAPAKNFVDSAPALYTVPIAMDDFIVNNEKKKHSLLTMESSIAVGTVYGEEELYGGQLFLDWGFE
jgi:hypothetical protein